MKKHHLIILIAAIVIIENLLLVFFVSWHRENKEFKDYMAEKSGLTAACRGLSDSESLYTALEKMERFLPVISAYPDKSISLSFGTEWTDENRLTSQAGTSLVFDKNNKLINKACQ